MNCIKCDTELNHKSAYRKHGRLNNYCRKCLHTYQKQRWNRIKTILVIEKGGMCEECKRTGHPSIFDFHHINPNEKDFSISHKRTRSIKRLRIEIEKCILLCACCHRTKHINQEVWSFDLNNPYFSRRTKKLHKCPGKNCDKEVSKQHKYCSRACAAQANEKIDWPSNLRELVANSSKRAVAASLGISDKAVAKRLKNHVT